MNRFVYFLSFLFLFSSCISTKTYEDRIAEYEETIIDLKGEVDVLKHINAQMKNDSIEIIQTKNIILVKLQEIKPLLDSSYTESSITKIQESISLIEALCTKRNNQIDDVKNEDLY